MLVSFDTLHEDSRVWIYQADRTLNEEEKTKILKAADIFIEQWAAHGQSLQASADIKHNRFLIIGTNEAFHKPSGCSIDTLVRFIQETGEHFKIDFFKRTELCFLDKDTIKTVLLSDFKSHLNCGNIMPESLFFDNNIQSKKELEKNWIIKANESWLKRYFSIHENV